MTDSNKKVVLIIVAVILFLYAVPIIPQIIIASKVKNKFDNNIMFDDVECGEEPTALFSVHVDGTAKTPEEITANVEDDQNYIRDFILRKDIKIVAQATSDFRISPTRGSYSQTPSYHYQIVLLYRVKPVNKASALIPLIQNKHWKPSLSNQSLVRICK